MLTAIIDYESGNLHSAKRLERMAREAAGDIWSSPATRMVARGDRIVLPGDGAFPACMAELKGHSGLYRRHGRGGRGKARLFLGICVGMQLDGDMGT